MKYLIYSIISLLLLTGTFAKAQPNREYEERQKKAANERALQNYIDDRIPVKGSGTSTTKYRWEIEREKQQRQELYDRERPGAEAAAERRRNDKAEEERKNNPTNNGVPALSQEKLRQIAEEVRLRDLKEAELRPIMEKNFKQYDFLNSNEVAVLTRAASTYNWKSEEFMKNPINYMHFNEIKNTGKYVELKNLILGFSTLTNQAVEASELLNKRFPEKMRETDSLMIKITGKRYPDLELSEACIESYKRLSPRLPAALLNSTYIWHDVTKSMVEKIKVEKQKTPVNTIELLKAEKEFADVADEYLIKDNAHTNLMEYLETLKATDLLVIGEKKNISPSFLALNQNSKFYIDLIRDYNYKWTEFFYKNKNNNSIVKSFEKIKELSSLGDLSAMYLYGIYIERGYTTEDKLVGEALKQKAKNQGYDPNWVWYWRGLAFR